MEKIKLLCNGLRTRLGLLLVFMLIGVNAWGQLPTTRKDLSSLGSEVFALVNANDGGKIIYGTDAQNAGYNFYSVIGSTYTGYTFVLETPQNGSYDSNDYLLKFKNKDGNDYSLWGNSQCYLNSQPGGSIFILGKNGKIGETEDHYTNGQDLNNGAVWTIIANGDGTYKLKNKGTNKYLNGLSSVDNEADAAKWSFCTLGTGCKVDFKSNNDSWGTVTGKRLDTDADVVSGVILPYGTKLELTAHQNSGYVFKNWSNGETGLTRVLTVTGNGDPSGTFEAESEGNTGYTVTFSGLYGGGNVTATRNDTGDPIVSGSKVPEGTSVTFTATPSGDNLRWKWVIDGTDKYSQDTQTITITKDITVNHEFGSVYVNVYTNNAELGTVNINHKGSNATTFHVTPYPGDFTLTATPTGRGTFVGWYRDADHTMKIDDAEATYNIHNPEGTNNYFAYFVSASTDHPAPTCVNNTIDLSKITTSGDCSFDGTTGTMNGTGDYLSIKFASAVDMHELESLVIDGTNVTKTSGETGSNGVFNSAQFICTGGNVDKYNNPANVNGFTDEQKDKLVAVTEIKFFSGDGHSGDFTINSITLNYGGTHTKKSKPVLNNGTTAEMVVSAGTPFTISASNGYWREYKSDLSGEKSDGLISGIWQSTHTFSEGLTQGDYYFGIQDNDSKLCAFGVNHHSDLTTIHVRVTEAFNPALDLNSSNYDGNVVSYTSGVLTVKGGSYNGVTVKTLNGEGNNYTGIRLTTQGKAFRVVVQYTGGEKVKIIDASDKTTTSYYSWSMLGLDQGDVAKITTIRFAGANDYSYSETNTGVTTFSNASLVNVTETTPYTRVVGDLREFNLNDTRVELYGHNDHYQMGGNIQWVYKVEAAGDKFATMKTTGTSWNQMEIFNSGHTISNYDGVRVDYKGEHFRVIAYKGEDKYIYTVPASNTRTTSFISWAELKKDGNGAGMADANDVTRIEVAGCSEHSSEEVLNFYSIRLQKELAGVLYTDESVTEGVFNGVSKLTYTETIDGKEMIVDFNGITKVEDRASDGCMGVIINKNAAPEDDSFTIHAPAGHKIAKVYVGLGENTSGTARFNDVQNVTVNNQDQIVWTNTTSEKSVTMGFPSETENAAFHIKYVYYELAEEEINPIEVNGQKRQYDVYKPADISGEVGVVISLHGASKDYYDDSGRINFNAIADDMKSNNDKKFIVVYPRGIMRQLRGTERGWATYNEDNVEDVEFFKAIVKDINDKENGLTVNMNRIYLAGYANGGMMAYKAAHQAGDFFAAFASVGGFPVNESHLYHAGSQPTPFMHIQGKEDEIFNDTEYNFFTISHNMTYRNGAHFNAYDEGHNSDGGVVADNANVEREIHVADEGGAAYFLYYIKNMTHVPSYDWTGDSKDDVAQSIWNFFDYSGKVNNIDKTLKFRMYDPDNLWDIATTGKSHEGVQLPDDGYIGFDNVGATVDGKSYVLSYGGRTNTKGDKGTTFDKDARNKNIWHSLQFQGGINGAAHFLKLNVETDDVHGAENSNDFFLVKLTKTGATTPIFSKRYQAGRGHKDLYINFVALPGFNEYKLEITKSSSDLDVKVHGIEAYSGRCEDKSTNEKQIEENPTAFYDVAAVLTGMNPIYQPVFGESFDGIAKEYLPIAEIPVGELAIDDTYRPNDIPTKDNEDKDYRYRVISDDLTAGGAKVTSMPSTVIEDWDGATTATITGDKLFNLAKSNKGGENLTIKSNNAYIFAGATENYTIDKVKGLNISQHGRAMMPEYLNGTRGAFPEHGVIAIKLQGTLDFYLLAQNEIEYGTNSEGKWDPNSARRTLKVYYTNDQLDGELKELKEWDFFGTRSENGYSDKKGQSLAALSAGVRLPQLGKDGTCTVFITYEGKRENGGAYFTHAPADEGKIWIKGFVIKRPDLKVTIGRTDSKYKVTNENDPADPNKYKGENNTKCTDFGENKPYIWSFENVGFNNTRRRTVNEILEDDTQEKKINENDGRSYVCGGTDNQFDHLLLYSDAASNELADKVQFDGRELGKEHIEFLKASVYDMKGKPVDDRKLYDPVHSNGLKVNVTGSGWFKIWAAAPNGPVNMKVYTQPNYGSSYISLLREFTVEPVQDSELKEGETTETAFREYTVYLKSRGIHAGNNGFWDGATADEGKEETMRQSLFVVFDEINETSYDEGHPQLNIHQLSWLNEEPADYVFQREEDPELLSKWQAIRRDEDGNKTLDDSTDDNIVLWWKASNDFDEDYSVLNENTYDRLGQFTSKLKDNSENIGVKSPGGYASTSVPTDFGTYEAYWDIAAPAARKAHTEMAYAFGGKQKPTDGNNSDDQYRCKAGGKNTEFDIPVSGSFIRICAMQNTYVVAHVLPGSNGSVYVLDETGNPIPYKPNGEGLDDDAKKLGYVSSITNFNGSGTNGGANSQNGGTMRIDFTANAGKEYFIVGNGSEISLARLEVHDFRYKPTKGETLALQDNANNSAVISDAYTDASVNETFYRSATLQRTFAKDVWASLVLPFSVNEKMFKQIFGENAKCLHFTKVDQETNTVWFTHHYYNMIVAGRPVFVCPDNTVTNPRFEDITLQTYSVNNTTPYDNDFTFYGSYDISQIHKNDLYINKNNEIKYLNIPNDNYPGMRSFIKNNIGWDFEKGVSSQVTPAKAMFLNFFDELEDEDISTDIESALAEQFGENVVVITKSTKVYDMQGRIVSNGADINNLPSGIYIVNGKKYIVK